MKWAQKVLCIVITDSLVLKDICEVKYILCAYNLQLITSAQSVGAAEYSNCIPADE